MPAVGKAPPPRGTAPVAAAHPEWAGRSAAAVVAFIAIAAAGITCDLVSKHLVFAALLNRKDLAERVAHFKTEYAPPPTTRQMLHLLDLHRQVCPGVRFTLSTNPGVVFGLPMPRWAVALATIATTVLVAVLFALSPRGAHLLHVSLALILAGAIGNLYDRLFSVVALPGMAAIHREVRDFIDCSQLHYPWVFNVSDAWLVIGVGLLMVYWFRSSPKHAATAGARK